MVLPDISSIRRKRKELEITQKGLATAAGVSQSLIAKLESGKAEASYQKVKRIFEVLDRKKGAEEKKCREVMCRKLVSASEGDNVKKAIELMKKHSISQLPVFRGDAIVGSISEATLLRELEKKDREALFKQKIGKIMEEPFPVVSIDTPASNIILLLKNSSAVLVSEKGKVCGIITKADLL